LYLNARVRRTHEKELLIHLAITCLPFGDKQFTLIISISISLRDIVDHMASLRFIIVLSVGLAGLLASHGHGQEDEPDNFQFFGTQQNLSMVLTNPYSGETINYTNSNANVARPAIWHEGVPYYGYPYIGGTSSSDSMFMTTLGDALFIRDGNGLQVVKDIEVFFAGQGGDLLFLADSEFLLHGPSQPTGSYLVASENGSRLAILAGAGNDVVWCNIGDDLVEGEGGDDHIVGGPGGDDLRGGDGNDYINGGDDEDRLLGGAGSDVQFGGAGEDLVIGHFGDDSLDGGSGDDKVFGFLSTQEWPIADTYILQPGEIDNDILRGGEGKDALYAQQGNDVLHYHADGVWDAFVVRYAGTPDAPVLGGQTVSLYGSNQTHDLFDGGSGHDTLLLTDGDDTLMLHDPHGPFALQDLNAPRIVGIETIDAGGGDDIVDLTSPDLAYGNVEIHGGDGNDVLWSSAGDDHLYGGEGIDLLWSGSGNDQLIGGDGHDHLAGGSGDDVLVGGPGSDRLEGESGQDFLRIGEGNDTVSGGADQDLIIYDAIDEQLDTLVGFELGTAGDTLLLYPVLANFDPENHLLSDFVQLGGGGFTNSELLVNLSGIAGAPLTVIAEFDFMIEEDLETLIAQGNIVLPTSLPGDFDGNGTVNGRDLLLWQRNVGSTNSPLDFNVDGEVGKLELFLWQSYYGRDEFGLLAALSVPEPPSAVLALISGMTMLMSTAGCRLRL
jgi:Ca2+-binding RTX toxin-like protein